MDFEEYLDEVSDGAKRLQVSKLQRLSNLNPGQAEQLQARWPRLDVRRRRRIVQSLVDLTEDDVNLNFDAVFLRGITDDDPDVRLESVRGLWENEWPDTIGPLINLLENDTDAAVRAEAALALGRFVVLYTIGRLRERFFEDAEGALRRVIEDTDEIMEVRARALEAIGAYDSAWVRQSVREAYESAQHRFKVSAVHAMGRSAEPRWLPLVSREVNSEEPELRYEAATALGMIGDEKSIPLLTGLLTDEDEEVRSAAATALGEIGGETAKKALQAMLDSSSEATRSAAAAALAELEFEEDPLGFKFRS